MKNILLLWIAVCSFVFLGVSGVKAECPEDLDTKFGYIAAYASSTDSPTELQKNVAKDLLRDETDILEDACPATIAITAVSIDSKNPVYSFCEFNEKVKEKLICIAKHMCKSTFCGGGLSEGIEKSKDGLGTDSGITTSDSLTKVVMGIINFLLPFAGLLSFVGLIYGGFLYLTVFANDQTEQAKKIIMFSVIGLLIIFLSYSIVSTVINFS